MKVAIYRALRTLFSIFLITLLTGCQAQTSLTRGDSPPIVSATSNPQITDTALKVVNEVKQWLDAHKAAGAVAVSYLGSPVVKQGFARDPDTAYPVASLSKAITAVCMQHLLDEQQRSSNLTLAETIPSLLQKYPAADSRFPSITLSQLISHNSGLHSRFHRAYIEKNQAFRRGDMADQFKALSREQMAAAPGSGYHYSNANYLLLGLAIESLSGRTYSQYCGDAVLTPAGITADINPKWQVMSAWGGWRISATDYLKFLNTYFTAQSTLGRQGPAHSVATPVGRGAYYTHGVFTRTTNGGNRFWHAGSWRWRSLSINDKFGAYFLTREDGLMVVVNYAIDAQKQRLKDLELRLVSALDL